MADTARRRYLLTGALGAIGVWTAKALLARGAQVVALDVGAGAHRLDLVLEPGDRAGLELVQGDIADLDGLQQLLAEREITNVVHLAALQVPFVRAEPARGALVNVVGTVNVLEAVRRAGIAAPVVYASSIAALGPLPPSPPLTLYGVFKRTNEETAVRYWEDYGVPSIGLRPHTVYGPGRDQGLTSAPTVAMLAAAAGVPYTIPFGGSLQFQYLPDVAEAFVRASELGRPGASVHTLDGPSVPVEQVVGLIAEASGVAAGTIGWSGDPLPFPGEADGSSFVDLLGGSVNRSLAEGVADAVERFRALLARGLVVPPRQP